MAKLDPAQYVREVRLLGVAEGALAVQETLIAAGLRCSPCRAGGFLLPESVDQLVPWRCALLGNRVGNRKMAEERSGTWFPMSSSASRRRSRTGSRNRPPEEFSGSVRRSPGPGRGTERGPPPRQKDRSANVNLPAMCSLERIEISDESASHLVERNHLRKVTGLLGARNKPAPIARGRGGPHGRPSPEGVDGRARPPGHLRVGEQVRVADTGLHQLHRHRRGSGRGAWPG